MSEKSTEPSPRRIGLDTPMRARARLLPRYRPNPDAFGEATEGMARFMGTPQFLVWMTLFCVFWVTWNSLAPEAWRFDSAALGFTALTLMLSLQASYAAPLLLLAQNRQDDRDRVSLREDRNRAERNLADTEYLTRELAGLRITLQDMATRDYVRSEMRSAVEDITDGIRQEVTRDLEDELREQIRAEVMAELAAEAVVDPASAVEPQDKDREHRQDRDRRDRRDRDRRDRHDDGPEGPQTTTLALLAAEEAARQSADGPASADTQTPEDPRP